MASHDVHAPFDGKLVGRAPISGRDDVVSAIAAADRAAPAARALPAWRRAEVLHRVAEGLHAAREDFARLLAAEAGKPVTAARVELDRAAFVFQTGAEEALRIGGELLPLDRMPHGTGRWGLTRRFPLSVVGAIVPFNFPALLAAHKLAPAVACGATIGLKTPPQDPLTPLRLGELFRDSGYPEGGVTVVNCSVENAAPLLDDPRIRVVTFTGSAHAGWEIRRQARKRVLLELGGNAGLIIEPDADLDRAVERSLIGGFGYAGQSCISVQRILVHRSIYDRFVERFVPRVAALRVGDPLEETTEVGPMIDEAAARRAEAWIVEAVSAGAQLATGGKRTGGLLQPTVLLDTTAAMKVNCEEVFAPVVTVRPYERFEDAMATVNDSPYGLQAGVFTNDLRKAWAAFETLEVGGVIVNDIPGFRVDHMPYGGVKQSGLGREGVRYAIEELTEQRLLVI
jgi:glyceraldehyde-3-phosphate dehydrogenase (NADP+)